MVALASLPKHRVYECARCHKRQTVDRMVRSVHTTYRYCADVDKCARRAKRSKR
jgi:hypothetical protein